jgi:hypothetical protein
MHKCVLKFCHALPRVVGDSFLRPPESVRLRCVAFTSRHQRTINLGGGLFSIVIDTLHTGMLTLSIAKISPMDYVSSIAKISPIA